MRTHEEHVRWTRSISDAQRSALEAHGIADHKVRDILARAYDTMSENCDEGEEDDPALWHISGDDMWNMLDGWGVRPSRIRAWLREERLTERFWPTKEGVAVMLILHAATKAAWNAPVADATEPHP